MGRNFNDYHVYFKCNIKVYHSTYTEKRVCGLMVISVSFGIRLYGFEYIFSY